MQFCYYIYSEYSYLHLSELKLMFVPQKLSYNCCSIVILLSCTYIVCYLDQINQPRKRYSATPSSKEETYVGPWGNCFPMEKMLGFSNSKYLAKQLCHHLHLTLPQVLRNTGLLLFHL